MLEYIILVYKNGKVADIFTNPEQLLNKVHQCRDAIATSVWLYDDGVIERKDLDAINKFEIEYGISQLDIPSIETIEEDNNMLRTVECPRCKEIHHMRVIGTDVFHCMNCDILIHTAEKDRCPDCGAYTYEENTVEADTSMGVYCANSHKILCNQYMTYQDLLDLEGEDYRNCDLIKQHEEEECLEAFKDYTAIGLKERDYDAVYKTIKQAMDSGLNCSESQCYSCPIVSTLKELHLGETCADFVQLYEEHKLPSASEASTRSVSDVQVEGASATDTI